MRACFTTLLALGILSLSAWGADIQKGATMQVKADSIWFQDVPRLSRWQKLKKDHSPELASYQEKELGSRIAWQFTKPLSVKILSYDVANNQVNVEMETESRMKGSTWWLDASALKE
jgi:hypothetical protein